MSSIELEKNVWREKEKFLKDWGRKVFEGWRKVFHT